MSAHEDLVEVLLNPQRWSSSPQAHVDPVLLGADPPEHDVPRAVLEAAMDVAVRHLGSDGVRAIVDQVLDEAATACLADTEPVDAVTFIAARISRTTLICVLGVPPSIGPGLDEWSARHSGWPADVHAAHAARALTLKALKAAIANPFPPPTILGQLGAAVAHGSISKAAAFAMCDTVIVGGLETTTVLLTTILELHAGGASGSADALVAQALRHQPPLRWQARTDTTTGQGVQADFASALREGAPTSLAFGAGIHRCSGETLARMQALGLARALTAWRVEEVGLAEFDYSKRITRALSFPVRLHQTRDH